MTAYLFPPAPTAALAVAGRDALFPLTRIFCVGRNYEAHAAESGHTVDRESPFYFTKSPTALVLSGGTAAYPPGTGNYHYEAELVVAIGVPAFRVTPAAAPACVLGYGVGLDMTRRDLQQAERARQRPWDLGKDVEQSAVLAPLTPAENWHGLDSARLRLTQNGTLRQDAPLADMVWKVPDLIAHLSGFYHLVPGDIIMTGTPAGVGPVLPGDRLDATIDGLVPLSVTIGPAD